MVRSNAEEAPRSPNDPVVAMDAKLMVATDSGDVNKLKELLKMEDAMAMVVVTAATSNKPSKDDQSRSGDIDPLLLESACGGSLQDLNDLLKKPPIPQYQESLGDAEEGVDHQAAAGAFLKGVAANGDTALHVAASNGDTQDFLNYAAIIHDGDRGLLFTKNHKGDTPLHCACRAGNHEMVSRLIELAADRKFELLREVNHRQETALHEAVRFEDGKTLGHKDRALLDADIAIGEVDKIIKCVNENKSPEIVKLLMYTDTQLANYPADGISPMYLAILLEKDTIALTLYLKSRGNLSYCGPDGQNALHVAVLRATDTVMIEKLLNWNKDLAKKRDKHGSTALHFASSLNDFFGYSPWVRNSSRSRLNLDIVTKVFEANPAAVYQADRDGLFPIHVAASLGTRSTIEFFLKKSPRSAGLCNADGRTFLHLAVEKRMLNIVSFICRYPVNWILNVQDKDGNTAMHLAVKGGIFRMCCALLGNNKVQLNLSNDVGETPLDLSRRMIPRGLNYVVNSEEQIYRALYSFGAKHSGLRWDCIAATFRRPLTKQEEGKESEKMKDATQTLIVGAVLIATVAFGAIFAPPGGYRADDHANGGTPTLAGRYIFDAYMMATTLAFLCSSMATIGLMLSGTSLVNLRTRAINFNISVMFMLSSLTSLVAAFSLAVYMVLAPVTRSTAIVIFMITPLVQVYKNVERIIKWALLARPLCVRKGRIVAMTKLLEGALFMMLVELWPLIVITVWAGIARIRTHH
ncbi:hypothetical protein QYE76_000345 [Lolium multiflorum]|uniref:PGG domain-containing protein n=1 Tax=Lolium multiflorum TaxID=4521 RepID=A0AAD8RIM6_LOLMU|nr:hypothetical protein QYE76_000345 [Lolium multiflorum]